MYFFFFKQKTAYEILNRVGVVGQGLEFRRRLSHFENRGAFPGTREDQVGLDIFLSSQFFEKTPAVNAAAGSGDSYNNSQTVIYLHPQRSAWVARRIFQISPIGDILVLNSEQDPCCGRSATVII